MSKQCAICSKKTVTGRSISHAHNVTSRRFRPNLQRVRAEIDGVVRRIWVCTRCIRDDKVRKPAPRTWQSESGEASQA